MSRKRSTKAGHAGEEPIFPLPARPGVPNFAARADPGAIAQLGERYNGIVEVTGSIPVGSTNEIKGLSGDR
jgi:hypothetical protein